MNDKPIHKKQQKATIYVWSEMDYKTEWTQEFIIIYSIDKHVLAVISREVCRYGVINLFQHVTTSLCIWICKLIVNCFWHERLLSLGGSTTKKQRKLDTQINDDSKVLALVYYNNIIFSIWVSSSPFISWSLHNLIHPRSRCIILSPCNKFAYHLPLAGCKRGLRRYTSVHCRSTVRFSHCVKCLSCHTARADSSRRRALWRRSRRTCTKHNIQIVPIFPRIRE